MSNIKCTKCVNTVTDEEKNYFDENDIIACIGGGYLCKSHWCECMPQNTPWKWLTECSVCGNAICKTCKCETARSMVCSDCYECLNKGNRI